MALSWEKRAARNDYFRHACCGSEPPVTAAKHEKTEGNSAITVRGKSAICNAADNDKTGACKRQWPMFATDCRNLQKDIDISSTSRFYEAKAFSNYVAQCILLVNWATKVSNLSRVSPFFLIRKQNSKGISGTYVRELARNFESLSKQLAVRVNSWTAVTAAKCIQVARDLTHQKRKCSRVNVTSSV